VLGPQHPDTAASLNNLAHWYQAKNDFAGARLLYERALMIWESVLGPEHPNTAAVLNNLAGLLHAEEILHEHGPSSSAHLQLKRRYKVPNSASGPQ
jgi:hypothetical protein